MSHLNYELNYEEMNFEEAAAELRAPLVVESANIYDDDEPEFTQEETEAF